MQSCGDNQGAFQLGDNHLLNQSFLRFLHVLSLSRVLSMRGIGYLVNYGIAVETSVVYANSQFL